MTRKDYEAIAVILKDYQDNVVYGDHTSTWDDLINQFCILFGTDNKRFNMQRFIDAINN